MKNRLYFIPAAVIIFTLLLVGTFLDLQFSQAIVHIGNYFTKIFAMVACLPVSLSSAVIAGFCLQLAINRYRLTWQRIILIVCALIAFVVSTYLFGDHLTSYHAFNLNKVFLLLGFVISLPGSALGYFLYRYVEEKHLIRNIVFVAVVIAVTAAAIEVIKILTPRVRYTTVSQMPGGLDFYRPWYLTNLNEDEINIVKVWAKDFGYGAEEHKSFPSGHSNISLATSFILLYFPFFLKEKKLLKYQPILFYSGYIFFLICAFSRIFGGAHYLSDTMFAGLLALMIYFIANEIYLRKLNVEEAI